MGLDLVEIWNNMSIIVKVITVGMLGMSVFMFYVIAERLLTYRAASDQSGEAPVPAWLYGHLRRWHLLSFLKAEATQRLLDRVQRGALDPARIERLVRVVDEDLGMPLHRAVEGAKVALSTRDADRVALAALDLDLPVTRPAFDAWIDEDLAAIDGVLARVLDRAGVAAGNIERVFATGGSSLVPAVRARLAARFGDDKLVGGEELTSVAWGLAARAREVFA